jgi:hypothetical protein
MECGAHPASNLLNEGGFSPLKMTSITLFLVIEFQYFTYFTVLGVLVGEI